MTDSLHRRQFLWHVIVGIGAALAGRRLAYAGAASADPPLRKTLNGDLLETVPKGALPSFAIKGGPKVQEAYRFAAAHGEPLRYMPCFCGCERIGHRSNEDCYITERHSDGRITFNSHSAG